MPTIKNNLDDFFDNPDDIKRLLKNTEDNYRPDNANLLYHKILQFSRSEIISDDFIELVHETLKAFNMNSKGAKLEKIDSFKETIREHGESIRSLEKLRLEKIKATDAKLTETISELYDGLKLVQTDSPLVTFSKTMHFFLPNLFMPIDRKYTLQFFYKNPPYKSIGYGWKWSRDQQKQGFFQIFEQFRKFANEHNDLLKIQLDPQSRWNRNIPKLIDNIIIAYVKCNMDD